MLTCCEVCCSELGGVEELVEVTLVRHRLEVVTVLTHVLQEQGSRGKGRVSAIGHNFVRDNLGGKRGRLEGATDCKVVWLLVGDLDLVLNDRSAETIVVLARSGRLTRSLQEGQLEL